MPRAQRLVLIAVLVLVLVALDQVTKQVAIAHLKGRPPIAFPASWYPHDLFHLRYAENTGAFLSLGSQLDDGMRFWVLTVLNVVILTVVGAILCLRRTLDAGIAIALTLVFAGGIGNLIDRLLRDGVVVDFMNMGIRGLRTGVFNVADVAIMAGLFLLLGLELLRPRQDQQHAVKR
ncbi:MAG: signal peptidase II [Candidatus Hydrogenedentes bacterium]|nr:signal peptidase II [Candidatus Hydrogenedentota bacterium]